MDITPQPPAPAPAPSRGARLAKAGALIGAGALAATALTGIAFGAGSSSGPVVPAAYGSNGYGMGGYGMGPGGTAPGGMGPGGMMGDQDGQGPRGHGGGMGMGLRGGVGGGGPLLHGEGVIKDQDGAYVTVRMQTGTVVSASASSVVIKSDDGVTWTWPVTSATTVERDGSTVTADKLVAGDKVRAAGTVKDGVVTTKRIHALSAAKAAELEQRREERQQKREERQQERQGGTASPSPSTTA